MAGVAVAGMVVSIGTSLLGADTAKSEGAKQRQLMWDIHMADLAEQERVAMEELRTSSETDRIRILSESLRKYREALQKESTIRLRDTWIYVAGLGAGTGVLYGLYLMSSKST
jgi:hypothetical protein